MYFGPKLHSKDRTARPARTDLQQLCQEMEARHQEVLMRARQKPKSPSSVRGR